MRYDVVDSPFGELLVAATDRGLCRIWFDPEGQEEELARIFGAARPALAARRRAARARRVLRRARATSSTCRSTCASLPFHEQVLRELAHVPYGTHRRRTARWRRKVGRPRAARAVGTVMNRNPIPIVLPCHRVLGANGSLTGYARRARREAEAAAARGCDSGVTRVVVVGGGFGGLLAARGLRRADVDVTLVDRQNFFLFQPLVYQVATGSLSSVEIAIPLRQALRRQTQRPRPPRRGDGLRSRGEDRAGRRSAERQEPVARVRRARRRRRLELLLLRPRRVGAARAGAEDAGRCARPARPDPERVRSGRGRGRPGRARRPG